MALIGIIQSSQVSGALFKGPLEKYLMFFSGPDRCGLDSK